MLINPAVEMVGFFVLYSLMKRIRMTVRKDNRLFVTILFLLLNRRERKIIFYS
jgi:hypothetical protein